MKIRKNILIIAGLLTMAVSVSAFAFINSKEGSTANTLETTWYFTGTEAQILDADFYRSTGSPEPDCAPTGDSPCSISVLASDQQELQEFLEGEDPEDVTAMSVQKRP
jgi:hypothetical protein